MGYCLHIDCVTTGFSATYLASSNLSSSDLYHRPWHPCLNPWAACSVWNVGHTWQQTHSPAHISSTISLLSLCHHRAPCISPCDRLPFACHHLSDCQTFGNMFCMHGLSLHILCLQDPSINGTCSGKCPIILPWSQTQQSLQPACSSPHVLELFPRPLEFPSRVTSRS